jgi:hypothetical protein
MWAVYAPSEQAVAVQSTFIRLQNVLPEAAFVGLVRYADYDAEWIPEGNSLAPYMHNSLGVAWVKDVQRKMFVRRESAAPVQH